MNGIECIEQHIEEKVLKSPYSEDPMHSKNTLKWVLLLCPDADEALQIAALGHDIERSLGENRTQKTSFSDFNEYKNAHAKKSAQIMKGILKTCGIAEAVIEDVMALICEHETGGTERSNYLRDADSLSFFDHNLSYFFRRNNREEVLNRCRWGYNRLSPHLRHHLAGFQYENKEIRELLEVVISGK